MTQEEKIHDQSCVGAHSFACLKLYFHFFFLCLDRRKLFGCTTTISSISCCKSTTSLLRKSTIDPPSAQRRTSSEINSESHSSLQWCSSRSLGILLSSVHSQLKAKQKRMALADQKNQQGHGFCPLQGARGKQSIIDMSVTCSADVFHLFFFWGGGGFAKATFKKISKWNPPLFCCSHGIVNHKSGRQ